MAAVDELFDDLTPCPLSDAKRVDADWRDEFTGWREAAANGVPAGLDEWSRPVPRPAGRAGVALGRGGRAATRCCTSTCGPTTCCVSADRVWLVDWPWAARGAPVFDLAAFAPSVAMQGGPEPAELLAMSRYGRTAEPEALTVLVATITGYFLSRALRPPDPGLPTVRAFQAAQGAVARRWLQSLTGWA